MRKITILQKPEKKNVARAIALAMATVLFASTAFTTQALAEKESKEEIEETITNALEDEIGTTAKGSSVSNTDKDETVYVFSDASGNKDHILVSSWLKNSDGSAVIRDEANLTNITNVLGDEKFTQSGSDITWQADGNDIYYQGSSAQVTPVEVKLTYYLNDKEVSPEEIAGKDGRVKIRFDYTNHTSEKVKVGQKEETVSVPFVVMSGMVLPIEHFSNVEVTNGKIISEGNKMIVAGMALPGLKESLRLDQEKLKEGKEAP